MLLNLTDREEGQSVWMGLFNGRILGSLAVFAGLAISGLIVTTGNLAAVDGEVACSGAREAACRARAREGDTEHHGVVADGVALGGQGARPRRRGPRVLDQLGIG